MLGQPGEIVELNAAAALTTNRLFLVPPLFFLGGDGVGRRVPAQDALQRTVGGDDAKLRPLGISEQQIVTRQPNGQNACGPRDGPGKNAFISNLVPLDHARDGVSPHEGLVRPCEVPIGQSLRPLRLRGPIPIVGDQKAPAITGPEKDAQGGLGPAVDRCKASKEAALGSEVVVRIRIRRDDRVSLADIHG